MIPAFVRRREQTTGLTYVAVPHARAMEEERISHDMQALGASIRDQLPDPVRYSDFTGGRGTPVFPSHFDTWYTVNPWTGLGGEGASWEWEHYGYKVPMFSLEAQPDTQGINVPIEGYPGMTPWPERSNEYRPPFEPYSNVVDQRTGRVNPWD